VLGQAPETKSAGDSLTGLPGSPGEAEGSVFLVLGPDDFPKFPKGSVLVARTTNPAWTPLFYGAIAVITESGGPLSHGAVTAREMGLPAVMAVKGCLGVLKNGVRVRVDGARGRVHLLPA
jgi:pyruvate,water dikinase